jgi:hypothetical protein
MDEEKIDEITSALAYCIGTMEYHQFHHTYMLTDGALLMAQLCEAFWLLDLIFSYQCYAKVKDERFQCWQLCVSTEPNQEGRGEVTCTDGDENVLVTQDIEYTDFPLPKMCLYLIDNVILLPSEY